MSPISTRYGRNITHFYPHKAEITNISTQHSTSPDRARKYYYGIHFVL